MKKKDKFPLFVIGSLILGIVISVVVYHLVPEDSKWMFWLWLMK